MSEPTAPDRPDTEVSPGKGGKRASNKPLVVFGVIAAAFIGYQVIQNANNPTPAPGPSTSSSGISLDVTNCASDAPGYATATVTLTSTKPYSYIELGGDFTNADGVVIGQGIGTVSNVLPGQTYRTDVIYSLSGSSGGDGKCEVHVESLP